MNQICYFCTTPFQIMTVIHLYLAQKDETIADLYIVDQFPQAEAIVERMKKIQLFRKVILVRERDVVNKKYSSKLALWPQMFMNYLNINKAAKKILKENFDVHYDAMYISSKAFVCRLVALYYVKNEFHTEIIYFDDGLGSYYNSKTIYPRPADKILRHLLLGGKASLVDPQKILLYAPNLFYNAEINTRKDLVVEKIEKWGHNDKCAKIANYVFGFSPTDAFDEPILILDSLYGEDERKNLNEFYIKVADIAGRENIIIKKHPRDIEKGLSELKYYENSNLPFELICQNVEMDKKLLIAVASTAVITPILLLDEEPYVLIINDIKGVTNNHSNAHYCEFKDMYTDKDRFYEARSIEDALAFVESFYEKYLKKSPEDC